MVTLVTARFELLKMTCVSCDSCDKGRKMLENPVFKRFFAFLYSQKVVTRVTDEVKLRVTAENALFKPLFPIFNKILCHSKVYYKNA